MTWGVRNSWIGHGGLSVSREQFPPISQTADDVQYRPAGRHSNFETLSPRFVHRPWNILFWLSPCDKLGLEPLTPDAHKCGESLEKRDTRYGRYVVDDRHEAPFFEISASDRESGMGILKSLSRCERWWCSPWYLGKIVPHERVNVPNEPQL